LLVLQQWFATISLKGNQIQTYIYVRELHKNNFPHVNCNVLFYFANEVCYTKY